jgi:hypothetical protein
MMKDVTMKSPSGAPVRGATNRGKRRREGRWTVAISLILILAMRSQAARVRLK